MLLLGYLWPSSMWLRTSVVLAVVFLVLAKLANVSIPLFFKGIVDTITVPEGQLAESLPILLLLAYGAARIANQLFSEIREMLFVRVGQEAIRSIALKTFRHLHQLSLRFHISRQTGGLTRTIERGTKAIEYLLYFSTFNVVPTLLEIALVTGILWGLYDWRFALITLVTISGYIAYTLLITEWRIKFRRQMNEKDNEANTKAVDSLLNYETVKYFGNENHEARRFDQSLVGYARAAVRSRTSLSLLNIGQAAIIALGVTAIMTLAVFEVIQGRMTVGDVVLVNSYLIQLYMPLNFLGTVYREIRQSLIDMEVMFRLLEEEAEIQDAPNAKPLFVQAGEVRFEQVSFGYDPRRPILKEVSFTVKPGQKVAIVGPSGAGKSTISRLLFRFYDVDAGRILIDGQDIRLVTQSSLRAAIGIVPQDTVLFNDTVHYNIAYGQPAASEGEIITAAKLARIHDFISGLPDGYESMVGERGLKLSGGEKQRVAIARTILKRPPILLFDEATSALDSHTEKEIQKSLNEVSRNHTTLIIAHRLSTVIEADEILVLEQGRIAERGTHRALLDAKGKYAAMWARQQEAAQHQAVE